MGLRDKALILCLSALLASLCVCFAAYTPPDNYLIDCGSPANTIVDGRTFLADNSGPWTLTSPRTVVASSSNNSVSSFDGAALYRTARIFPALSSYSFPIKAEGRHFIRLYFFPFINGGFNLTTAKFSVVAQHFTLLSNFEAQNSSMAVVKEYSMNVTSNTLTISFMPSDNYFAFISAIEVVSVPDALILDVARNIPSGQFNGLLGTALQSVYRINMGGPKISPSNDTLGRTWIPDRNFLVNPNSAASFSSFSGKIMYSGGVTQETAPDVVYKTATQMAGDLTTKPIFNVTWEFSVETSSTYLVRMHFCDVVSQTLNQLLFNVYIGSFSAYPNLDLSSLNSNALAAATYIDFVVEDSDGSGKLRVSVGPTAISNSNGNAILNGLEIMKMNNSLGSLDGLNRQASQSGSKNNIALILGASFGAFGAIVLAVVLFVVCRKRKIAGKKQNLDSWIPFSTTNGGVSHTFGSKYSNGTLTSATSGLNNSLGFCFPFAVLQEATNSFDENWVIGVGGFGKVYKGVLRDDTKVAVKRGNPKSQQGVNEFRTEIELLSRLRHRHLVSLIGYCDEGTEMILVYEYMENGTLKSHLYGSDFQTLSWKQRLEICIGSARGLHYLHTGQAKAIIHRDVKSANILLDENLTAKVADFGLSKTGPELDQTHVSTAVKGSFGYLDPEYFRRQQLTEKSDVYSFGVVLLEVLCARPVIDPTLAREMVNLAEWAMKWQKKGQLAEIIDAKLAGKISPESLRKFGETAEKCLAEYGADRPSMGDVLWNLEYALQLQESLNSTQSDENSVTQIPDVSPQVQNFRNVETGVASVEGAGPSGGNDDDLSNVTMSKVFSQLIKSEGR